MTVIDKAASPRKKPLAKTIRGALLGGIVGGGSMAVLLPLLEGDLEKLPGDVVVAIGVAAVCMLMALFVGLGTAVPTIGEKWLNVDDADELREERRQLVGASIMMAAMSAALFALIFNALGRLGSMPAALVVVAAVAIVTWMHFATRNAVDEMARSLSREGSALGGGLIFCLFGGWAILTQFGWAAMFTPLGFVAGSVALYLAAVFWLVARRGLMTR